MKKLILIAILLTAGWQAYTKYQGHPPALMGMQTAADPVRLPARAAASPTSGTFRCDGRTYCSQMTSCEEATFFLRNCPGVKMDGNNDGVPCEKQWCR